MAPVTKKARTDSDSKSKKLPPSQKGLSSSSSDSSDEDVSPQKRKKADVKKLVEEQFDDYYLKLVSTLWAFFYVLREHERGRANQTFSFDIDL